MDMKALKNAERLVAGLTNPDSVIESFDAILGFVANTVDCDQLLVALANEEDGNAKIIASRGIEESSYEAIRFPLGEGILGELDELHAPLHVPPTTPVLEDASPEQKIFASGALLAPVYNDGVTVGAVGLFGCKQSNEHALAVVRLAGMLCTWATRNVNLYQDLEKRLGELTAVFEIGKEIVSTLNTDNVLQLVIEKATRLLGCDKCSVMLINNADQTLRIFKSVGLPEGVAEKVRIPVGEGISGRVAASGKPILIKDIEKELGLGSGRAKNRSHYRTRSLLSVPLVSQGVTIGVVNVNNKKNDALFTQGDLNLMTLFANQVAIAIQNARLHSQVERLAITDSLTGLHNRAFFTRELAVEFLRAVKEDRPLSVLMCDIDHFKAVNDTYGHGVGDDVLKRVSELLKGGTRDFDVVARYGGEEFIVLLRGAPNDIAARVAERLRASIERARYEVDGLAVTASFGLCSYDEQFLDADALIKRSDDELYRAKDSGRNRVCGAAYTERVLPSEPTPESLPPA
jgi:diguanylate cyclase (GGDEF)-like protein